MADLAGLSEPFRADEISWRLQRAGKKDDGDVYALAVPYINRTAIQNRLDELVGPAGWSVEYTRQEDGSVWAGLTIHTEDGPVTKWDGSGAIQASPGLSESDAAKGTLSVAFKRAAVAWGVGRYLVLVSASFAQTYLDQRRGRYYAKANDKAKTPAFSWDPPELPEWALPGGSGAPPVESVDPSTGEIREGSSRPPQPSQDGRSPSADAPIDCPKCEGPMRDLRAKKEAGEIKPKSPDLACKDRDGCGFGLWLDSWARDLKKKAETLSGDTLTLQEAGQIEVGIISGDPEKMLVVHRRLQELAA